MKREDFIERLDKRRLLAEDTEEEWEDLKTKHPYSALVQLLNYQKQAIHTSPEKKELRLFFEQPLQLQTLLKTEAGRKERADTTEINLTASEAKKENISTLYQQEEKLHHEHVTNNLVPGTSLKEEELAKEIDEVDPVIPIGVDANFVDEQLEVHNSATEHKKHEDPDDVLELINELPEENPIKKHSAINEQFANENVTTEKTEQQNLMVMMSFTDWLQFYKKKKESDAQDKKGRDAIRSAWQKEKLAEAMDDEEDVVPDEIFEKAMKSVSFGDGIVTEPLAELYVKQGKTDRAIELYKKLSLLNPEKKTYFAAKIKNLHL